MYVCKRKQFLQWLRIKIGAGQIRRNIYCCKEGNFIDHYRVVWTLNRTESYVVFLSIRRGKRTIWPQLSGGDILRYAIVIHPYIDGQVQLVGLEELTEKIQWWPSREHRLLVRQILDLIDAGVVKQELNTRNSRALLKGFAS